METAPGQSKRYDRWTAFFTLLIVVALGFLLGYYVSEAQALQQAKNDVSERLDQLEVRFEAFRTGMREEWQDAQWEFEDTMDDIDQRVDTARNQLQEAAENAQEEASDIVTDTQEAAQWAAQEIDEAYDAENDPVPSQ